MVRRTGLSPHVLRVWEKRYGAVTPQRTTTNRRLYSDADIAWLRMLRGATLAGQSIGQIAGLANDELSALIALDEARAAPVTPASAAAAHPSEPKAVALSIVYPADDPHLDDELKRLRRILPNTVAILVGGRAAKAYDDVLASIGAVKPSGIAEFRTTLATLRQPRPRRRSRR